MSTNRPKCFLWQLKYMKFSLNGSVLAPKPCIVGIQAELFTTSGKADVAMSSRR